MSPDLATVAVFLHRDEAELAKARLAADGIEAAIRQDDEFGLNPGFYARYGVRLEVRANDRDVAGQILTGADDVVWLPSQIEEAMFAHARFSLPFEACGLLACDQDGVLRFAYGTTNVDQSPLRFTVDPTEHFFALRHAERSGWEIAGDFHSHPASAAEPSANDVAGALDPTWIHVIVGVAAERQPEVRAYRIMDGDVSEVALVRGGPAPSTTAQ